MKSLKLANSSKDKQCKSEGSDKFQSQSSFRPKFESYKEASLFEDSKAGEEEEKKELLISDDSVPYSEFSPQNKSISIKENSENFLIKLEESNQKPPNANYEQELEELDREELAENDPH